MKFSAKNEVCMAFHKAKCHRLTRCISAY